MRLTHQNCINIPSPAKTPPNTRTGARSEDIAPHLSLLRASPPFRHVNHYLFSYDIKRPARAKSVRNCLKPWRIDGQLSVHETRLTPAQAETLAADLIDCTDTAHDSLLLARLSQRGKGPISVMSRNSSPITPLLGAMSHQNAEPEAGGCYLLAYDIHDARRLRRVHALTVRHTACLQKSVYLYQGTEERLIELRDSLELLIVPGQDDVRFYHLASVSELRFLCGSPPPLLMT